MLTWAFVALSRLKSLVRRVVMYVVLCIYMTFSDFVGKNFSCRSFFRICTSTLRHAPSILSFVLLHTVYCWTHSDILDPTVLDICTLVPTLRRTERFTCILRPFQIVRLDAVKHEVHYHSLGNVRLNEVTQRHKAWIPVIAFIILPWRTKHVRTLHPKKKCTSRRHVKLSSQQCRLPKRELRNFQSRMEEMRVHVASRRANADARGNTDKMWRS